jgi:hypothetical protein
MAGEVKDPRLRIVHGTPYTVEDELNKLLDRYTAVVWNFPVVHGEALVTVILVLRSELQKQVAPAVPMPFRLPNPGGGRYQ